MMTQVIIFHYGYDVCAFVFVLFDGFIGYPCRHIVTTVFGGKLERLLLVLVEIQIVRL
jgi:hypothetical protein